MNLKIMAREEDKGPYIEPYAIYNAKWHELNIYANVGMLRRILSVRERRDRHGAEKNGLGWNEDIGGAGGEYATSHVLNIPWDGSIDTFKMKNDVGLLEVRTAFKLTDSLIVREEDKDDDLFILVLNPTVTKFLIMGGIYGKDAKRIGKYMAPRNRPPAWFVHQTDLIQGKEFGNLVKSYRRLE